MEDESKGIHIGIIPDGSRRWARKNRISNYDGRQSGEAMEKIVKHVLDKYPDVSELSLWALSTENLGRADKDKELVYMLLIKKIKDLLRYTEVRKKKVRVRVIGSRWKELPKDVTDMAREVVEKTRKNKGPVINLCIGYGGKQEILDASMAASRWLRKNPKIAKLHENVFERFLMVPRPLDIVIRTGGEHRLSGFMLYQIEYAELFFSDTLWPDFSPKELDDIMARFRSKERRFGK